MDNFEIPKRLGKEPLLEAVWEIRFSSSVDSVVELLPGLIYSKLRSEFTKTEALPPKNLPREILNNDPNLRYVPQVKLHGNGYELLIGNHVIALSYRTPYPGWEVFRKKICELWEIILETGLVTNPERFSLKYVDLISISDVTMNGLNVSVQIGGCCVTDKPIQIRTEIQHDDFTAIIQVATPVKAFSDEILQGEGILIDIDTILMKPDFMTEFESLLNKAHLICKDHFFKILKRESWTVLGAEY